MIGKSEQMQSLKEKVKAAARVSGAVLITGESGSGKELVARAIRSDEEGGLSPCTPRTLRSCPPGLPAELIPERAGRLQTENAVILHERTIRAQARRFHDCGSR